MLLVGFRQGCGWLGGGSETVALGHPVMPVGDGFVGCFVRLDGLQLRQGTTMVRPCHLISTSMSLAQASSRAMPWTSTVSRRISRNLGVHFRHHQKDRRLSLSECRAGHVYLLFGHSKAYLSSKCAAGWGSWQTSGRRQTWLRGCSLLVSGDEGGLCSGE